VNRILRIDTDRWVTGRAIRWACEDAREADDIGARSLGYTEVGTSWFPTRFRFGDFGDTVPIVDPAIVVTVTRDNEVTN
jgi:hypothetical protein